MRERAVDLVVMPDEDAAGHHRLALALRMLAAGNGLHEVAAGAGYEGQALVTMLLELSFGVTATAQQLEEMEGGGVLDDEA